MLGTLLVATLLSAGAEVKLAAPGLTKLGITQEQARFYSAHLVARLSSTEWLKVVSSDDIAAVVGMERQRQLLGCAEGKVSCMAELAGALGVDGMVTGQVARVGKSFQVNVKVIDTAANALYVHSSERLGSEEAVLDELETIAGQIAEKLEPLRKKRLEPPPAVTPPVAAPAAPEPPPAVVVAPQPEPAPKHVFWPALGVAGVGVAALGVSAFGWVTVNQEFNTLHAAAMPGSMVGAAEAVKARDAGNAWQLTSGILTGVGVAALVGGLLWYFLHEPAEASR